MHEKMHKPPMKSAVKQRLRLVIRGAVQGVGFRPFIFRLANALSLNGWSCNTGGGVLVEVEGEDPLLREFLLRVAGERPEHAVIQSLEPSFLSPVGYQGFEIRDSQIGAAETWIMPEIATCADCRREILDTQDRRFRYPFTNCTHCGPRYSIVERLPYDRMNTSMKKFLMCPACKQEYDSPEDRRFHAQPNACPECGPHLQLWNAAGNILAERDGALCRCVQQLREGKILALKGLGGFHLMVDAAQDAAVLLLRKRKQRLGKPFALMFPDMASVKRVCDVSPMEERLLVSPEAPVVLLRRHSDGGISQHVAPGNPYLGVMLPYSPLHILLLNDFGAPLIATSGNLAEETICTDETEALSRLAGIADLFLVHDRPIVRAVDDSVVRVIQGKEQILRRARGYAPLPILLPMDLPPTLAVGGHLKNCVALAKQDQVFVSQHIGDLETPQSCDAFRRTIDDLQSLHQVRPSQVVCDLHPDYHSSQVARSLGLDVLAVQHHEAHVLACLAENEASLPALGVAWDGSGYGRDGAVWGGEFFIVEEKRLQRFAHFEYFPLPGGEAAVREPRRSLLGALYAVFGEKVFEKSFAPFVAGFDDQELGLLRQMLKKGIHSPLTSSVGRRFDAMAALAGLANDITFEGEAAMALEFALPSHPTESAYSFQIIDRKGIDEPFVIRAPIWDEVLADIGRKESVGLIAEKFHHMLIHVLEWAAKESGLDRVALTGGCFQNRYLTERAMTRLSAAGVDVYCHQRVPPNDGGIALGQIVAAARHNQ